jgi:hypothetical protein
VQNIHPEFSWQKTMPNNSEFPIYFAFCIVMSKSKGASPGASKTPPAASSAKLFLLLGVLVVVVVGVLVGSRNKSVAADASTNGVIFTDALKDGSYPNVTSRIQILGELLCVFV